MHPLLNIAFKAARSASKIIVRSFEHLDSKQIAEKSTNDFVTEVDRQSEQEIISIVRRFYPDHAFWGEEYGKSGDNEYVWIIDPLDGTANYIHNSPHFSISIAVKYRNRMECGLIYDPLRQELFTAENGGGAYFNNRRMRVSLHKQLAGSLLGIGFAHNNQNHLQDYLATLEKIECATTGVRRSGSAALDLAYVACGRLDGLWEFNLKPWDMAAGTLMVTEAGGLVSDFNGINNYMTNGNIIAANAKIFQSLLQTIQECLSNKT